ncbi:MAG: 1-acyl-sn-glycerol-3-phosphate acyltransferase [Sandaracinaceae bacterium]
MAPKRDDRPRADETFLRQVVFGARHGLFKVPILGAVLRATDTVPIYRAQVMKKGASEAERDAANQRSLDALSDAIVDGKFSALFPEGVSHDAPHPMELKTGVARFAHNERASGSRSGDLDPVVIPVGLHYDEKRFFRSTVLVAFHPPIELPEALAITPPEDEDREVRRARFRAFTDEVERVLREVVHATESWDVHHLMHRARKLLRAERAARAGSPPREADDGGEDPRLRAHLDRLLPAARDAPGRGRGAPASPHRLRR